MLKSARFMPVVIAAAVLIACTAIPSSSFADKAKKKPPTFRWTGEGADPKWSTAANWAKGDVPDQAEKVRVFIGLPKAFQVLLDGDVSLSGLMHVGRFRANTTIDLGGHTLTMRSGTLRLGDGTRSPFAIKNGTLHLGGAAAAVNLDVHRNESGRTSTLKEGVTVNTVNLRTFALCVAQGNRVAKATLDISQATFADNTLRAEALAVATYRGLNTGCGAHGTLKLPPTLKHLTVDSMLVGVTHPFRGRLGGRNHAVGIVDFGGGDALTLTAAKEFVLSRGDNTHGELRNLPETLHLRVGSEAQPAVMHVGYKHLSQSGKTPDNFVKGFLELGKGDVVAHLSELRVAENTCKGGIAIGEVNFGKATSCNINVAGPVVVGPQGRLTLRIADAQSGLRISGENASLRIDKVNDESGVLVLRFDGPADKLKGAGLHVAGDHTAQLGPYLADGRIVVKAGQVPADRIKLSVRDAVTVLGVVD